MSRKIDTSKPLSNDEVRYLNDRPWLVQDLEMQGVDLEFEDQPEPDEPSVVDYNASTIPELIAEIDRRNEEIEDESDRIVVEPPGNKPEIVAALEAHDEANK